MIKQRRTSLQMMSNAFIKPARLIYKSIVLVGLLAILLADGFGYNYTANSADRSLKSDFKVDPATLAMSFEIPLGAYPNRGGGSLPISIRYSSKLWRTMASVFDNPNNNHVNHFAYYGEDSSAGWTSSLEPPLIEFSTDGYDAESGGSPGEISQTVGYIARLTVTLGDGSGHELRKDDLVHSSIGQTGIYTAVDGTGMRYDADNKILYMTDGSRYFYQEQAGTGKILATKFVDANGNRLAYNAANRTWTDTLGRSLGNPLPAPREKYYGKSGAGLSKGDYSYSLPGLSGAGNLQYTLKWRQLIDPQTSASIMSPDANGSPRVLKYAEDRICKTDLSVIVVTPHLFDSDVADRLCAGTTQGSEQLFNPVVLAEVVLPDGRGYKFNYNEYGEIDKVTYPTGATERFEYAGVKALDPSGSNFAENRGVVKRLVSPTGQIADEQQWTYSNDYTNPAISGSYFSRAVAPDGTFTAYRFNVNQTSGLFGFKSAKTGKLIEAASFTSNGEILSRTLTDYYEDAATYYNPGYAAYRDARQLREINIVFENGAAQALASQSVYEYDANSNPDYRAQLNPKRIKTYGFVPVALSNAKNDSVSTLAGAFSSGSPVKTAETDYLYSADYLARNMTTLPSEIRVLDANNAVKSKSQIFYDEALYAPLGYGITPGSWENPGTLKRGQATTTRSFYDIANNLYVETHMQSDQFGQPRKMWDGRGNLSQTEYDATYYTFPVKSITPKPDPSGANGSNVELETLTSYDPNTGLTLSTTDANGQTTAMSYADPATNQVDPLLRIRKVTAPNGQQTITEYGAGTSAATDYVKVKTQLDTDKWKESYTWFDGLGRTVKTQSVDTTGDVFALTCYDAYGRMSKVSNAFRNIANASCSSSNLEWTTTVYDSANRIWKVTTPDNATVETNYSLATAGNNPGTVVTVKDQANKERRSITNSLGQLTRVDEPTDAGGLGTIVSPSQPTFYSYDILNNLTTVSQGSQTRTFVYDSLSRLKSANNPESGLIQYSYDSNSNLTSKTDGRSITTQYFYDALNRVTQRSYSGETGYATPTVLYFYDNLPNAKGKLIKVSNSVSTTEYSDFDILGRALTYKQMTDGQTYSTRYIYNLSGALVEQTYHSGRVVRNVFDSNGNLSEVESKRNAPDVFRNYATNFVYTAAGAVSSLRLGNGKFENTVYNSRLQPVQIGLGSSATNQNLLKLNFDYGTTDNNGNVKAQTITTPTAGNVPGFVAQQTYSYDSLNRLKQAQETINNNQTPNWKQTFSYDRFGNRRFDETNGNTTTLAQNCPTAVCNPQVDAATNKLIGYTFDNAGNTKTDAENRTFTYDGENKQVEVKDSYGNSIGRYFYDGDGKRVKKISLTEITLFIYDAKGQLIAEYSTNISQQAQTAYTTMDHLGSSRISTNALGQVISRHDYEPFGEEIARSSYGADDVRKKFTGYERDTETNLDYAQARMYAKNLGRFTTPDDFVNDSDVEDPQSWGKYLYVRNNPLTFNDPTGKCTPMPGKPCTNSPIISGPNHVPNQPNRENVKKVNELGYKDTPTGGHILMNVESQFAEGDNISDYRTLRTAILPGGTIRSSAEENPVGSQVAVEGNSKFVTDSPGLKVDGAPKGILEGKSFTGAFITGEYNTKTKTIGTVAYYGVKIVYGKDGNIDQEKSQVVTLTKEQFVAAAKSAGTKIPKNKEKQEDPELLLKP